MSGCQCSRAIQTLLQRVGLSRTRSYYRSRPLSGRSVGIGSTLRTNSSSCKDCNDKGEDKFFGSGKQTGRLFFLHYKTPIKEKSEHKCPLSGWCRNPAYLLSTNRLNQASGARLLSDESINRSHLLMLNPRYGRLSKCIGPAPYVGCISANCLRDYIDSALAGSAFLAVAWRPGTA